ncbi:MAG: deoxyribodipyrimidine photo-lyase [Phycisphaerae bacterium]|jgi:deoxyribodipyrimidine photo-lyase
MKTLEKERITTLNNCPIKSGKFVVYWMQTAQRTEFNHALEYAIKQANNAEKPLIVLFCINPDFPDANARSYHFMLEGLVEVQQALKIRNIRLVIQSGRFEKIVPTFAQKACEIIVDAGYLKFQQKCRWAIARKLDCRLTQIETNLIVPPETACEKEEYSARTIRPRITKQLKKFLKKVPQSKCIKSSLNLKFKSMDISAPDAVIKKLRIDQSVSKTNYFKGGTSEAKRLLKIFIKDKLSGYGKTSNDPSKEGLSNMSPYLHFGQISPVYIALEILKHDGAGAKHYLEELIIRRELAHNFVYYNSDYDKLKSTAGWAMRTLNFHRRDKRQYIYTLKQLENAQTHDKYWNAAQMEMVITGKMHGYMRMYWGKKIIEWSKNPNEAFKTAIYLNNKYELDGRDPNGYAGICWCFGKHDTAWTERPIFGKVRYMNAKGLERKFDMEKYVQLIATKALRHQ